MRAHPLGLLGYTMSPDELVTWARDVARITHSHHLGVTGGIIQALAVYHALHGDTPGQILEKIKSLVHELEKDIEDDVIIKLSIASANVLTLADADINDSDREWTYFSKRGESRFRGCSLRRAFTTCLYHVIGTQSVPCSFKAW